MHEWLPTLVIHLNPLIVSHHSFPFFLSFSSRWILVLVKRVQFATVVNFTLEFSLSSHCRLSVFARLLCSIYSLVQSNLERVPLIAHSWLPLIVLQIRLVNVTRKHKWRYDGYSLIDGLSADTETTNNCSLVPNAWWFRFQIATQEGCHFSRQLCAN